ncbi:hypothetical protein VB776_13965 [Arcicella sp. DC2W]|uniref:Lipocalin-like domain-containing protein n=1 Tax=Arcicella gelida TaxID=2984195 RepID=A0ABU5S6G0_9BACT|nr:hypothetical protein [Arcicella sp. DC2W]MEA5404031.1 hypothetical protein [Arcicella sp. DC2W]
MKLLTLCAGLLLMVSSCQSVEEVNPSKENGAKVSADKLVGKWNPTYIQKGKSVDAKWETINTLVALPTIEFTADGKFLSDGKPGADCCGWVGNKYTFKDSKIIFSDFNPCPDVACIAIACDGWTVQKIESDTLVLESCFNVSKFVKAK